MTFQNNKLFQETLDHPNVAYYISNISRKFGWKRLNTEFTTEYMYFARLIKIFEIWEHLHMFSHGKSFKLWLYDEMQNKHNKEQLQNTGRLWSTSFTDGRGFSRTKHITMGNCIFMQWYGQLHCDAMTCKWVALHVFCSLAYNKCKTS